MHKNTRLLPYQRQEAFRRWQQGETVSSLAEKYSVSRNTIYKVLKKAKLGVFTNYSSMNWRYRKVFYGLKKLSKTETQVAAKIARREHRLKRYEKDTPGEMIHFDTKQLPLLPGESGREPREILYVGIDDFSRQLFADILPDKTQYSSAIFPEECRRYFPFEIECAYSDNGPEFKGRPSHAFVRLCDTYRINQKSSLVPTILKPTVKQSESYKH